MKVPPELVDEELLEELLEDELLDEELLEEELLDDELLELELLDEAPSGSSAELPPHPVMRAASRNGVNDRTHRPGAAFNEWFEYHFFIRLDLLYSAFKVPLTDLVDLVGYSMAFYRPHWAAN